MLTDIIKLTAYKLSQATEEQRKDALMSLGRINHFKFVQLIAAMTEIYVAEAQGQVTRADAIGMIKQAVKDAEKYIEDLRKE